MSISVVILTLNEEENLPGALQSIHGLCDDVVVCDSFSSDATCNIAAGTGARVVQRSFKNYAQQRNTALTEIAYRHPWVLMLDADERVTPSLWNEMLGRTATANTNVTLFRIRRKDHLFGRWIKRSSGYPTWFGRLIKIGRVQVRREVNEIYSTDGQVERLAEHLLHFPFNRGFSHWLDRHNDYSTREALLLLQERERPVRLSALLSSDPTARRYVIKQVAYRLPCRPLLIFAYLYVVRGGFLEGRPGLIFCMLRAIYEFLIDLKVKELRSKA